MGKWVTIGANKQTRVTIAANKQTSLPTYSKTLIHPMQHYASVTCTQSINQNARPAMNKT
jgi:hypothetical protein